MNKSLTVRPPEVMCDPVSGRIEAVDETDAAWGDLPELLLEIAEVAGLDAALTLADQRGGNRVYIPREAGPNHWLTQMVGQEAADALCDHFGQPCGLELELPRGPQLTRSQRQARVQRMIVQGLTSSEITRRTGVTRRTVKRNRATIRRSIDGVQLDMFASDAINSRLPAVHDPLFDGADDV